MRGVSPGTIVSRSRGGVRGKQTTLVGRRHSLMLLMVGFPGLSVSAYMDVFERLVGVKVNSAEASVVLREVLKVALVSTDSDTSKERYVRAIRQANIYVSWSEVNRALAASGYSSIDKRFYDGIAQDISRGRVMPGDEVSRELALHNHRVVSGMPSGPGFFE
mgnify:CR=1 FL=1